MRRDILDALLAAKAQKRAAALVTKMTTGAQTLVEPARGGDLQSARETGDLPLDAELRGVVVDALRADTGRTVAPAGDEIFVQPFNPPQRLAIVGAVHLAQPLAPMARLAGYDVTVIDPRRAFASPERFPGVTVVAEWPDDALEAMALDHRSAVVALTHDPKIDDPALEVALRSPAFYIAALGSTRTHAKRLERLGEAGFRAEMLDRIHGPAGLAIGAVAPAEIAVAILAQMTAVLRGRSAIDPRPTPRKADQAAAQAGGPAPGAASVAAATAAATESTPA